jgi:predicted Zn-dependent protease
MNRLIIAAVIAVISLVTYFTAREYNPVTRETQHVDMTVKQEIALGLQAAPEVAKQFGGLHADQRGQAQVDNVGKRLVSKTEAGKTPYKFGFHVLADEKTINAMALPGGQVFITAGLMKLLRTEGELAAVLGHEIGHVVARHAAEHIAKAKLTEGLTGAAVIATYDPDRPSTQQTAAVAALIGQLVNMRFGRKDELESDQLGVRFTSEAGYDPGAMIRVMEVLAEASKGPRAPEFFSTHPNPDRRVERIKAAIQEKFPNEVPDGWTK